MKCHNSTLHTYFCIVVYVLPPSFLPSSFPPSLPSLFHSLASSLPPSFTPSFLHSLSLSLPPSLPLSFSPCTLPQLPAFCDANNLAPFISGSGSGSKFIGRRRPISLCYAAMFCVLSNLCHLGHFVLLSYLLFSFSTPKGAPSLLTFMYFYWVPSMF